jgi:hypothetical protein
LLTGAGRCLAAPSAAAVRAILIPHVGNGDRP